MIRRLEVDGLNGSITTALTFHSDLNVLTGRNGSGKTSVLKLIWFILSGNLDVLATDLSFQRVSLDTDDYSVTISVRPGTSQPVYDISWDFVGRPKPFDWFKLPFPAGTTEFSASSPTEPDSVLWQLKFALAFSSPGSVFFPTFRRIEGGFAITERRPTQYYAFATRLDQAMSQLAERLSTGSRHRFVSSLSTQDIGTLLTERYADISAKTNALHKHLSDAITMRIRSQARDRSEDNNAAQKQLIEAIEATVDDTSAKRDHLLKPFTALTEHVDEIFGHRGIKMTETITLGEHDAALASDKLSAGEKHMLSFLCYNAFVVNSPVIIDEPELSLHVDWQRILFATLAKQATDNQFIVATHSPFIYSKYPDREIRLHVDRG